jgi:hypothetical protein
MTKSAHKVEFIREKGKAASRDRQGAQKIGGSLSFKKAFFFFLILVLFVWEGIQESGVEWSFNISLYSPAKSSCLLVLWHSEASPGGHGMLSCMFLYRM